MQQVKMQVTCGNMLARKTFNTISLAQDDKLTVEWKIEIG